MPSAAIGREHLIEKYSTGGRSDLGAAAGGGPYAGRILQVGSAVLGGDGTLLGISAEVEKYKSDAGRRAVMKPLLGFPKFTLPKLKPSASA